MYKLKPFLEDGTLKNNKNRIARELEVDRHGYGVEVFEMYMKESNLESITEKELKNPQINKDR